MVLQILKFFKILLWTSLAVQWLRLHASSAGGKGSIPGQGAGTPHSSWSKGQNIKQKQDYNKFNKDFKKWSTSKIFFKKITNHQGNANQSHEISAHTCQNGCYWRDEITSACENVEKREPLGTAGGNLNWYSHYGKRVWSFLKKFKNRTTTWSSNWVHIWRELKRFPHPYVHCSIIYNSQDMGAT